MYGAVCIVFGIENKNYVKRTNSYLGQQSCVTGPCPRFVWVGGVRTWFHILCDICCVGEAYMVLAQQQNIHISLFIHRID